MRALTLYCQDVLQLISDVGGMSRAELEPLTARDALSVGRTLRILRKRKLIYIGRYDRQPPGTGGRLIPIYYEGDCEDVRPPYQLPDHERHKRYREQNKAAIAARRYPQAHAKLGIWKGLMT
jgi:hypothetical protein